MTAGHKGGRCGARQRLCLRPVEPSQRNVARSGNVWRGPMHFRPVPAKLPAVVAEIRQLRLNERPSFPENEKQLRKGVISPIGLR